jgi:hypothetical protein
MIPNVMLALVDKLAADGRVSAEEALQVRRAVFPDGTVSRGEAEALFHLNERVVGDDPAWNACFIEAIGDHLTLAAEPTGHITDEGAAWLESRITRDGVLEGPTELELLLKVLERADSAPARLHVLARDYVSRAVLSGEGYEGRDIALVPGQIGDAELAMIKRTLYACAGAGDLAVTREEAEWLFELDAATEGRAHVAGWRDLFVSAVMNHLFAAGPSALLERGGMLRRASWLNSPEKGGGIGGFMARAFEGGWKSYVERVRQPNAHDAATAQVEQRQVEAQLADALTTPEAAWLVTRIRADGRRTANEQALLDAVKAAKGDEKLKSA